MAVADHPAHSAVSGILSYDRKLASYKIALLRALNDACLAFPDVVPTNQPVAVPLRILASFWLAYYWPFVDPSEPIYQAPRAVKGGRLQQDMAFRPAIERVYAAWGATVGAVKASDGFFLLNETRLRRPGRTLAPQVVSAFGDAISRIALVVGKNPIRYAGEGEWSVFPPPVRLRALGEDALALPGARPEDMCVLVSANLWCVFRDLSLWVEALCIHEWCQFLESASGVDRGVVYKLLTDHPDNRRPLTWERNQVDLLMLEGARFACPWTGVPLDQAGSYEPRPRCPRYGVSRQRAVEPRSR